MPLGHVNLANQNLKISARRRYRIIPVDPKIASMARTKKRKGNLVSFAAVFRLITTPNSAVAKR